ncbi:hypothetical protein GCM10025760_39840 [Microbacterium yannicii]|uniref:Uncharacterized protein n=1 Tax=Microbacterium yannicii TaxID=671622 RepID=A0ABP9MWJ9_9MICO
MEAEFVQAHAGLAQQLQVFSQAQLEQWQSYWQLTCSGISKLY